jgi:Na+/melibiose symporter-like transporter
MWGYGIGHFLNDLTGAIWYNYLLYFLVEIEPISETNAGTYAGLVVLSGLITDSIITPLNGYLMDRFNFKIGRKRPFYIVGMFIGPITSFLFIF